MMTAKYPLLTKIIGWVLLLAGAAFAFIAPLELYVFYLLGEHGRLHIQGFGFGSFMFANVAIQIAGYYTIAALCLILGYGHLKRKAWLSSLVSALSLTRLIVGLPLTLMAIGIFIQSKDPAPEAFWIVLPVAAALYPVLPLLLLVLYRQGGALDFAGSPPTLPLSRSVLLALLILAIYALHGLMLFRGLFPFFGVLLYELQGITALSLTFVLLLLHIYGMAGDKRWSWWATTMLVLVLILSTLLTLPRYALRDILDLMLFAPQEVDAFARLPFLDAHLTKPALLPLLLLLAVLIWDKVST